MIYSHHDRQPANDLTEDFLLWMSVFKPTLSANYPRPLDMILHLLDWRDLFTIGRRGWWLQDTPGFSPKTPPGSEAAAVLRRLSLISSMVIYKPNSRPIWISVTIMIIVLIGSEFVWLRFLLSTFLNPPLRYRLPTSTPEIIQSTCRLRHAAAVG